MLTGILLVSSLALILAVRYTELCELKAVTLNGERVPAWDRQLGLRRSATILQQPVDSVADALLTQQGIRSVNIDYVLPNMLRIETNDLTAVCVILDANIGILYGLDASGRVVPLDKNAPPDWEQPFITGAAVIRMYSYSTDARVSLIVPQLLAIRDRHPQLYRLINEVDCSHPDYLTIRVSGLPCLLKVHADRLLERLDEFVSFAERYQADLFTASVFDLRYDNMIVREAQPEKKKKGAAQVGDSGTIASTVTRQPLSQAGALKSAASQSKTPASKKITAQPAERPSTKKADSSGARSKIVKKPSGKNAAPSKPPKKTPSGNTHSGAGKAKSNG
ncbi:MAG: hypothetical protein AB1644_09370 [Candidatus Zixiibacteriota bacterium]